jgi:urea carboxylase
MVHGFVDVVEAQLRLQVPGLAPKESISGVMEGLGSIKATGHAIEVRAGVQESQQLLRRQT